jgi:hypothetical protein
MEGQAKQWLRVGMVSMRSRKNSLHMTSYDSPVKDGGKDAGKDGPNG